MTRDESGQAPAKMTRDSSGQAPAKKKRGAKHRYRSSQEMQAVIDGYFERCKGHLWMDLETGEPYKDKNGVPIVVDAEPPTVTGLALALGFTSRQALLNYQDREAFVDTVTRAKLRVEHYNEMRLFDKDGISGAKFNLANNFQGWSEKRELEHSGGIEVELSGEIEEWAR